MDSGRHFDPLLNRENVSKLSRRFRLRGSRTT